jgi:cytoskeletal protein CcmA (bactofilin family)
MLRDRPGDDKTRLPRTPTRTILGTGARFVGRLHAQGDVAIEDIFEGEITSRGVVRVGQHGTLDGSLVCREAVIAGLVRGNVTARAISITATGRILGDLQAEKLLTEEGTAIQGMIRLEETLDLDAAIARHQAPHTPEAP